MKAALLYLESSKEPWSQEVLETYSTKISRFCEFDVIKIKSPSLSRENALQKINEETKLILSKLKPDDFLILLDEKGKAHESMGFAKFMANQEQLPKRSVFLIGGAFGVSDEIKKRANATISLSSLVMNHHVALTVLLEQIYRAFTILKKIPYHNQ